MVDPLILIAIIFCICLSFVFIGFFYMWVFIMGLHFVLHKTFLGWWYIHCHMHGYGVAALSKGNSRILVEWFPEQLQLSGQIQGFMKELISVVNLWSRESGGHNPHAEAIGLVYLWYQPWN